MPFPTQVDLDWLRCQLLHEHGFAWRVISFNSVFTAPWNVDYDQLMYSQGTTVVGKSLDVDTIFDCVREDTQVAEIRE